MNKLRAVGNLRDPLRVKTGRDIVTTALGEGEAPVANANLDLVRLQARRHQHPAGDLALLVQGAWKGLPGIPGRPTFPDISACQLQEQGERHHMA